MGGDAMQQVKAEGRRPRRIGLQVHGREGRQASLAQYIQLGRSAFAHAARTNSVRRENDEISLFAEFSSLFRRRKFPVL
jgi:hypothetical protein